MISLILYPLINKLKDNYKRQRGRYKEWSILAFVIIKVYPTCLCQTISIKIFKRNTSNEVSIKSRFMTNQNAYSTLFNCWSLFYKHLMSCTILKLE